MKILVNKPTIIKAKFEDKVDTMTYSDLIKILMNVPPKNGWTTSEMRSRMKIEDKIEDVELNKEMQFEDAEYDKLVQCLNISWDFKHKDIIEFEDYILSFK
jgi:hypothetical protein